MVSEELLAVLRSALNFGPLIRYGITDILFDPSTNTVGLSGKPLQLENFLVNKSLISFNRYYMNYAWAKVQNIAIQATNYGTSPQWFNDNPDIYISDFLAALADAIRDAANFDEELNVTITPTPGYPWTPNKTDRIFSAKNNKWVKVSQPAWLMYIKDGNELKPAVDFCVLAPRITEGLFDGEIGVLDNTNYIVTHSTSMYETNKLSDDRLKVIQKCNGMLFPSLATGQLPATNFGETVLVFNASLPLITMKPYKKRGVYTMVTYPSDVWTDTTIRFIADLAVDAFDQLHGHTNWTYTQHLHILGPQIKETGFVDTDVKPILSTVKLLAAIKRKNKLWKRDLSLVKFQELSNSMTPDRYGYLETKAHAVLDWSLVKFAVYPFEFESNVRRNLNNIGFTGPLLPIKNIPNNILNALANKYTNHDEEGYLKYQYSWIVADAIAAHGRLVNIEI